MDLKSYAAAVETANAEVKRIARKIDKHFKAGEQDAALALRSAFDQAKTKAMNFNGLYLSMRNANEGTGVTPLFALANLNTKKMCLPEFNALDARERMKFIQTGGQIIPKVE